MKPRRLASEVLRNLICVVVTIAVVIGLTFWLAPPPLDQTSKLAGEMTASFWGMVAYGVVYLLLTWRAFTGLVGDQLKAELARSGTERRSWLRRLFLLSPRAWAATVAFMAVAAVLVMTVVSRAHGSPALSLAGICCVLGAWVLLLAVFAVEYGRLWARSGAFRFPDDDGERRFTDFVYLAIQVSTTFSSSDVEVLGSRARQAVSAHCLTAWAFSTVFIALLVSLALPG